MTTSVKVTAHCGVEKHVCITRSHDEQAHPTTITIIQNGESNEQVVYDGWSITVHEELKSA